MLTEFKNSLAHRKKTEVFQQQQLQNLLKTKASWDLESIFEIL